MSEHANRSKSFSAGSAGPGPVLVLAIAAVLLVGCNYRGNKSGIHWFLDMHDSIAVEAQEEDYTTYHVVKGANWERGADGADAFGGPGSGIRVPPEGSVPREYEPYPFAASDFAGASSLRNPLPRTEDVLARGQNRYNTYCAVCHGVTGAGDGPVVPRFPDMPALTSEKIAGWSDGEIYHIISVGRARMRPYAYQLPPNDRWAVIHYTRLLQQKAQSNSSN